MGLFGERNWFTYMRQEFLELRRRVLEDLYRDLNPAQREAVFATGKPLLILAGAGSGKTTVLVNKIGYLIRYGNAYHSDSVPADLNASDFELLEASMKDPAIRETSRYRQLTAVDPIAPYHLLAITFTNKAAGEMRERMEAKFNIDAHDLWALTFHSTCVRILRRHGDKLGYGDNFTIYDDSDSLKVVDQCLKELNLGEMYKNKYVRAAISGAKEHYLTPADYAVQCDDPMHPKLPELYARYARKLKDANAMDFDDLIFLTVKLFETFPEVKAEINNKFRYILVDEYQDTNPLQYRFVSHLASHGRICVVGDDDQSIYRFMGASIENILSFEKSFPDAEVVRLEQNYRSTQTILNAANAVISHNTERKGKTLWTENGDGEKIDYRQMPTQHEEADFISNHILSRMGGDKSLKFSDFCVLYRTHAQSGQIELSLKGNGIPYRIYGGVAFFKRKEIQDMLAYLNVINNPYDFTRLMRIVNEPKRGIGDTTLNRLREIAEEENLHVFDVMKRAAAYPDLKKASDKLIAFADMIEDFRQRSETGELSELYRYILKTIGYEDMLMHSYTVYEAQGKMENLNELLSSIKSFEDETENPTLTGFLEQTALISAIDNMDADADAVVLMTMHCAKGLEFHTVFLTGFEEGIFPSAQSIGEEGGVEEERRLCYVALTRAKRKLYLLSTRNRMMYGNTRPSVESRFLKEIPSQYLDEVRPSDPVRMVAKPEKVKRPHRILTDAVTVMPSSVAKNPTHSVSHSVGQKVKHKIFGAGVIVSVTPMANDTLIEVKFDSAGSKKLMANFAKLEVID